MKLSPEIIEHIKTRISTLENRIKDDERYLGHVEMLERDYPGKDFGRSEIGEVIGYTTDAVSTLKKLIGE